MIIANRQGHTKASPGASDVLNEIIENEPLLKEVNRLLIEKGHKIVSCYPGDGIGGEEWNIGVAKANSSGAYLFFSIHFNSTRGAYGCEILTSSMDRTILPYANKILSNLQSLGFTNRGIKIRDDLAETVGIDFPTMIIEVCFIHEKDAEIYKRVGMNRVARAIANGIDNSISLTENNTKIEEEIKVENIVVFGNDIDKRGAEYLADKLQCATISKNTPYDFSRIKNVYCIGGKQGEFTGYCTKFISGASRYDTCQAVLNFIKTI
ncbi:N-acetylmuramoyl-L-alanine amidase [Clostridium gasigenes]|uniref:N-acetylmuramoyl-L-alanine amidase n=1 Tax=Clostridium gasigenes TaxID=94869 RepID=A0A1H0M9G7_9CLOT|nr:N-acetylmuramoyl-L-alanine amidase [Clostridium gasigenes]SDO76951.1 N-acetylmuramoyl-L-alanine amidase [Clostridium gasigenes]